MKVHAILDPDLDGIEEAARAAEEIGYDGMWVTETRHDPFLPLLLAGRVTERLQVGTAVAIAFPRSPMHLAQIGNDLQAATAGRFVLGLGSQVRAHIERRFSATWSHPVERMRELLLAVQAVWSCWNDGERLDFRGDFYRLDLMTPFFSPQPNPHGAPDLFLAAVGPRMTEVAGEAADGLFVHGFTTPRYLREVVLPALERGIERAGRTRGDVQVSRQLFVVTGRDEQEMAAAARQVKEKLSFYGSTPAYRRVLEMHGRPELQGELAALAREGAWDRMADSFDDELLEEFAVVAPLDRVAEKVQERFGGLVDRISFNVPFRDDPQRWGALISAIQAVPDATGAGRAAGEVSGLRNRADVSP